MLNNKHIFWEALLITLFIFGLGILLGIYIENGRASDISEIYLQSEINLLDIRVQTEILNLNNINCAQIIQKNIEFGDEIYKDAEILGRYEGAGKLTDVLLEHHRRYDALRALFWVNSIRIKEKCNDQFHTVVYLYDYNPKTSEEKTKQYVFSKFLYDLKQEQGNNIVLIPIARNLNLTSVDLLANTYNIKETSIIVDENLTITRLEDLEKINAEID
ncbi:MAG: hypothetical protein ACOYT4_03020 [Nanoarchaeota archaeon]